MSKGMKRRTILGLAAATALWPLTLPAAGAEQADTLIRPADGVDLGEFLWLKRPVIVFADSAADPRYQEQMGFITDRLSELESRDVVVITDTDPAAFSDLRRKLRPRGFMLVLIGKDGQVKLRKPSPWSVREISRSIDKMPMRQQEIRDAKERLR